MKTPVTVRTFHLGDMLSVTTGTLLSPRLISGVYDILDYIEGESHWTHELLAASERCKPVLLAQYPWLAEIVPPGSFASEAHVWNWLKEQTDKYGEQHEVKRALLERSRSPIETLAEMVDPSRIITISASDTDAAQEAM